MEFYNYPPNKRISPFEPVDADNYFAEAGRVSYLGTFGEIGNISSPFDRRNDVLNGAYVLNIFKRHSIVQCGEQIYINGSFDDGHIIGASRLDSIKFVLYTDMLHEYTIDSWKGQFGPLQSYAIRNDDGSHNCALWMKLFPDADSAIQHAVRISENNRMKCIVAQWFADIDRH